MATILTETEAAAVLRVAPDDQIMLDLLPQVDAYIKNASGRDWAADEPVRPEAKSAARMLLVKWYEDPGTMGVVFGRSLDFGLSAALMQLEALALLLEDAATPPDALRLRASMPVKGASEIHTQANLILVFNHEMSSGAPSSVSLVDAAGIAIISTYSLDVTKRILTIAPDTHLQAQSGYRIEIQAAADVYGLTLTDTIRFTTA